MFSQKLEVALVTAVREAKSHKHEFVTVEHLLYGILQDELTNRIIRQCGGSLENIKKRLEKFFDGELPTQKINDSGDPIQTLGFNRVLQRAIGHVQSCGKKEVDSGDVLVAIFSEPDSHAVYFLSSEGLDRMTVVEYISHGLTEDLEPDVWQPQKKKTVVKQDELDKFTVNFADKARAGLIDPLIGRERELERIMQVLCRRRKNNPLLVGEPGVGKSILIDQVASKLPEQVRIGHIRQTLLSADEFLLSVCLQLGLNPEQTDKPHLFEAIKDYAMDQHLDLRPVLLVIDEAQNLNSAILEEIRLLANLEMFGRKLIQIILLGHPELGVNITSLPNDALMQLVRLNHHMNPLSREEIREYIDYRLYVAGNDGRLVFPKELLDGIVCYTGGIPRLINQLCDMMLITAYINQTHEIDTRCLHSAIHKLAWPLYIERKTELPLRYIPQDEVNIRPLPLMVVRKGDVIVGKYLLNHKRMLIGRQKNLDICIDEAKSSRIHAQLVYLDGQFFIHDLNSMNGTHLESQQGEKKVRWYGLSDQDVIRIGQHTLTYQVAESEQPEVLIHDLMSEDEESAAIA